MARAVRYQASRASVSKPRRAKRTGSTIENAEAKARAVASDAARKAARNAPDRIRKSSAKRVEEEVISKAKQTPVEERESMKSVVRTARRAVRDDQRPRNFRNNPQG